MLFRSNLIFLSIVASGVAFIIQGGDLDPLQFGNAHVALGAIFIFFSTLIAAMAYTSSNFHMGVKPSAITEAHTKTRNQYLTKLSREYESWVTTNHEVHRLNAHTINAALVCALASMVFFFGGVIVGGLSTKGSLASYVLLAGEVTTVAGSTFLVYFSSNILQFFVEDAEISTSGE